MVIVNNRVLDQWPVPVLATLRDLHHLGTRRKTSGAQLKVSRKALCSRKIVLDRCRKVRAPNEMVLTHFIFLTFAIQTSCHTVLLHQISENLLSSAHILMYQFRETAHSPHNSYTYKQSLSVMWINLFFRCFIRSFSAMNYSGFEFHLSRISGHLNLPKEVRICICI